MAAQSRGVMGFWREPEGSVIQIERCGDEVCAKLVAISKTAPAQVDGFNPDKALRTRSLCGLQIGRGFHLNGPDKADGGRLYDPKSGRTYRGALSSEAGTLHLRGYVGLKAFGRTEDWIRTAEVKEPCR